MSCTYFFYSYLLHYIVYADDTVILSETEEAMQRSLNIFQLYCEKWKLEVNLNKTKVMIFRKRKSKKKCKFLLLNKELEIVEKQSYLGVIFKYYGTF